LRKSLIAALVAGAGLVAGLGIWAAGNAGGGSGQVKELTIYSGRSEEFIAPFFAQWEQESGIKLNIRYGDSAADSGRRKELTS
jgi:iron(III) transport system substrate-binding protein